MNIFLSHRELRALLYARDDGAEGACFLLFVKQRGLLALCFLYEGDAEVVVCELGDASAAGGAR